MMTKSSRPPLTARASRVFEAPQEATVSRMQTLMLTFRRAVMGESAELDTGDRETCLRIMELPPGDQLAAYNEWTLGLVRRRDSLVTELKRNLVETTREKILYEAMAFQDALTGAYNRHYFADQIKKEMSRINRNRKTSERAEESREEEHLSILFIDADHFKAINDTLDHGMGDTALKELMAILKGNVRDYDTIARWGGEEFIIMLNCDEKVAERKAQTIRTAVEQELKKRLLGYCQTEQQREQVAKLDGTISVGLVSYSNTDDELQWEELVKRADRALIHSKETGRNKVTVYGPEIVRQPEIEV